jgi:hypothetical protein
MGNLLRLRGAAIPPADSRGITPFRAGNLLTGGRELGNMLDFRRLIQIKEGVAKMWIFSPNPGQRGREMHDKGTRKVSFVHVL